MKIYTKGGDKGKTSLNGGTRIDKFDIRIETYGTVDELNAYVGLIRSKEIEQSDIDLLIEIQDRLFTIGSNLAASPKRKDRLKLPPIKEEDIEKLEKAIDIMTEALPMLRSFVLPGGHPIVSYCHLARCVCRRAERNATRLNQRDEIDPIILKYLNRLSDFFFTLSRKMTKKFDVEEVSWVAKL